MRYCPAWSDSEARGMAQSRPHQRTTGEASRILLVSANRCTVPDPVFPLGLVYLNAALRRAGHTTAWFDRLASAERLAETLEQFRPDFIGISLRNIDDVLIRQREVFFDELTSLKSVIRGHTSAPIILGGSGFSILPKRLLEFSGADYGIVGEGERALLQLIEALNGEGDLAEVPGLVFLREGGLHINPPAPSPPDLEITEDDLPEELAKYYLAAGSPLNLQTQRGCHFLCCYCTYPLIEGDDRRRRPPEQVAADLERLQRRGAKFAFIVDSVFNSTPRHVVETCEAILRRGVKMSWSCFLRPQGLTAELMDLMARAGLTHIEFGSDSFSDTTLEAYQKQFTFDDILISSELARRRKVEYCHFLISGGPGETEVTLEEGFQNSLRLQNTVIMAVVGMRIYPGTPLCKIAVAEARLNPNADLLRPAYYLAPGLTEDLVFARLQDFARRSPSWIVGDPAPGYLELIRRLRRRGVIGPLWSFLPAVQRLWQPSVAAPTPK
jgi:radical SAM superfamily enzyme YgiQ (UPF0313 family)